MTCRGPGLSSWQGKTLQEQPGPPRSSWRSIIRSTGGETHADPVPLSSHQQQNIHLQTGPHEQKFALS